MESYFWNVFMVLMGGITIVISFFTYLNHSKLLKNGQKGEAKMIYFSEEKGIDDSPYTKIPVFTFTHEDENGVKKYFVK